MSCYLDGVTAVAPTGSVFFLTQLSADKSYCREPLPAAGRAGFPSSVPVWWDEALIQSWSTMDRNEELRWFGKKENCIYAIRSLIVSQLYLVFLAIKV